jgi:hypothetical protein
MDRPGFLSPTLHKVSGFRPVFNGFGFQQGADFRCNRPGGRWTTGFLKPIA